MRLRQQSENIGYLPREGIARPEKQHIALAAKNLIPDGARVALGTGTTVETCTRFLASHKDLFVASNSIHAVCALQQAPALAVELAGGPQSENVILLFKFPGALPPMQQSAPRVARTNGVTAHGPSVTQVRVIFISRIERPKPPAVRLVILPSAEISRSTLIKLGEAGFMK